MARILSTHGNVTAVDFRPRSHGELTVRIDTEILYQDEHIVLMRATCSFGGRAISTLHFAADLASGRITTV